MKNLLLALLAVSGIAYAADTSSMYKIDPTHSFVEFRYNHMGFSNPSGKWLANGMINFDSKDISKSSVNITINVESVTTGVVALDNHLQSEDFFNVAKYPTATFVSTKITPKDATHFTLVGNLTLHGITKPVTLAVTQNKHGMNEMVEKDALGYSATGTIKRSDFGVGAYAPAVSDDVTLDIELEARQQTSTK